MESETVAFLLELDGRLRKDRKWIREAEFFHAREGAQYVDGLRADIRKACDLYRSGDATAAMQALRGDEDDPEEDE
jgi:hypothetical protein